MIIINSKGSIRIPDSIVATIAGYAATNCFGIKGMTACGLHDGIVRLLGNDNMHRGVKLKVNGERADIDLHVAMQYGVNMKAVASSVMSEVKYVVERHTGVKVGRVNVYVDKISADAE